MVFLSHAPLNYTLVPPLGFLPPHETSFLSKKGLRLKSRAVRSSLISTSPVSNDKRRSLIRSDLLIRCCTSESAAAVNAEDADAHVKETPRLSERGARFIDVFLSRIVPWEEIPVSFDNFPYYTDDHTKSLLLECVSSHVNQTERRKCVSSSNRIQLQSLPGTDLYREKLVSAVARELKVPLLKLDSSMLPPYDISQNYCDYSTDEDEEDDYSTDEDEEDDYFNDLFTLKKGERVIYEGKTTSIKEVKNRTLYYGHRGEVHDVRGDKVAVIFNDCGLARKETEEKVKEVEKRKETVTWLDEKDVDLVNDAPLHDCFIAMELLYEVLESRQPMIVYFPDTFLSILDKASRYKCYKFCNKMRKLIDKLSGHVVLIFGQNKREAGSKEMDSFTSWWNDADINKLVETTINKIFTTVMCIKPPKDEDLEKFIKQIEQDKKTVISEVNLSLMQQVVKAHRLLCTDLEQANTTDMILTRKEVEKIVVWAVNDYISKCPPSCLMEYLLKIPHESLKLAMLRFTTSKETSSMPNKRFKDLAKGSHEKELVSSVNCAGDIGVKFDDVGALENVKKTLYETVILPLKRPELFSKGNLKRTCKGLLLFGPPGTGKTLMAKALATEAGANFINVTSATLTSKWYGESERLVRALFTYARKLAPAIIFVDEVDSLLGARGYNKNDTSRLNEFMAAWDGLISNDSQRILVIGATNRPFDLDDAIIRRMPRRIYVGLPDAESREKILKVLLSDENLEPGFPVAQLAEATQGYSGSDLKNLCVAAAYRPVEELLERESMGEKSEGATVLRPLNIYDYIHCKAQVRPSVSCDASSIKKLQEWDEQYGEGGSFTSNTIEDFRKKLTKMRFEDS